VSRQATKRPGPGRPLAELDARARRRLERAAARRDAAVHELERAAAEAAAAGAGVRAIGEAVGLSKAAAAQLVQRGRRDE
jgi:hypothetical protein